VPRLAGDGSRRAWVGAAALAIAAAGIVAAAADHPWTAMVGLCLAAAGFISVQPVFWTFPSGELAGRIAAGGIALINSCGALGGFMAPNLKAWADRRAPLPDGGLWLISATTLLGALLFLVLRVRPDRARSSDPTQRPFHDTDHPTPPRLHCARWRRRLSRPDRRSGSTTISRLPWRSIRSIGRAAVPSA
jgi:hypothetical protein